MHTKFKNTCVFLSGRCLHHPDFLHNGGFLIGVSDFFYYITCPGSFAFVFCIILSFILAAVM
jgi:hypothetical protein